jgi:hypothetical protein
VLTPGRGAVLFFWELLRNKGPQQEYASHV